MYAVIMAGGKGTRFWPLSRERRPKQLLKILGERSLLEATIARLKPLVPPERIIVVTAKEHARLLRAQARDVPARNVIVEPEGKNTAPCIGLAAVLVKAQGSDEVIAALPSDHLIRDEEAFRRTLAVAAEVAAEGDNIVTLGIRPSRPETGYGYIRCGEEAAQIDGLNVYRAKSFHEKPSIELARQYLTQGQYLWNSGIFIWKASTILESFRRHLPKIYDGLCQLQARIGKRGLARAIRQAYSRFESISIDHGIMEKAENIFVIPADFGWSDLGSWAAMREVWPQDEAGNAVQGQGLLMDTAGAIIYSPHKLVAAIGVKDLIVVDTKDALLICAADRAQQVRQLVQMLERRSLKRLL